MKFAESLLLTLHPLIFKNLFNTLNIVVCSCRWQESTFGLLAITEHIRVRLRLENFVILILFYM